MKPPNRLYEEPIEHVFFFCCIGGDLLICAGISEILKGLKSNYKTTLLLPAHSRVDKMQNYYRFFDMVIELPYCSFEINFLRGIPKVIRFLNALNKIEFPPNSTFFMFDVYDCTELLFYDKIRRLKKQTKVKLNILTAFDNGELEKDKRELLWIGTLLKSFYSIPFTFKFFYEYKTKGTDAVGLHFTKTKCDLQICIESSKYNSIASSLIQDISYPPNIFLNKKNLFKKQDTFFSKTSKNIIILIDSMIAPQIENYWKDTNEIISKFKENGFEVFLKDHPLANPDLQDLIRIEVNVIPNKIHLEELLLVNKNKIKLICGYGSTGLLTASWLGICAVNLSELYNFPNMLKSRFRVFVTLGKSIQTAESLADLPILDQLVERNTKDKSAKDIYIQWENIMST